MKKILEERLENARNDWLLDKSDYLRGQMVAYRDCLNLIPAPRTEQEILNDFEKLGYQIPINNESELDIGQQILDGWYGMRIYKYAKVYKTYTIIKGECHCAETYMQEHKLLNELFECYGFLE